MNSVRPSIHFTMETEHNGSLAFLDVFVSRKDSTLSASVYHKPTHTNLYLNFKCIHHPRIKTGIVQCLKHRAHALSHHESLLSELDHLQKAFFSNGYPKQFMTRCLHKKVQPPVTSDKSIQEEKDKKFLVHHTSKA